MTSLRTKSGIYYSSSRNQLPLAAALTWECLEGLESDRYVNLNARSATGSGGNEPGQGTVRVPNAIDANS